MLGDFGPDQADPHLSRRRVEVHEPGILRPRPDDVEVRHDGEDERASRGDERRRAEDVLADDIAFFGSEMRRPPHLRLELEVEADRELVLRGLLGHVPGQADAAPAAVPGGFADLDPR